MSVKDGGPAFPQALNVEEEFSGSEGMSLRDYFAAHAPLQPIDWSLGGSALRIDAVRAYRWADAMLAARNGSTD